jgi:hypothetical protein
VGARATAPPQFRANITGFPGHTECSIWLARRVQCHYLMARNSYLMSQVIVRDLHDALTLDSVSLAEIRGGMFV